MTVEEVTKIVVEVTGVSLEKMKTTAKQEVVCARHLLVLLLHEESVRNMQIARYVKRTHTAIAVSLVTADNLLSTDKKFKAYYLACIAEITKNDYEN